MKQLTVRAAVIVMLAVASMAHAGDDRAALVQEQMERTIEQLDLTDEQMERVKPILEDSRASRQAIMAKYGVDPDGRAGAGKKLGLRELRTLRKELDEVQQETNAELKKILTAQQLQKLEVIQQERKDDLRQRIRSSR